MPIEGTSHAAAGRRYAQKTAQYVPTARVQKQLNRTAESIRHHGPAQCSALSALYLSAVVLPNILHIRNTPANVNDFRRDSEAPHQNTGGSHCPPVSDAIAAVPPCAASATLPPRPALAERSARPNQTAAQGWLRFPMADAAAVPYHLDYLEHDELHDTLIARSDEGKRMLLDLAKSFLLKMGDTTPEQINAREFEWLQAAAQGPIVISRVDLSEVYQREKRISFAQHRKNIYRHIKRRCAQEMEIYNTEGLSEGKMLIFTAQRIDNPFRMLYDDIPEEHPARWKEVAGNLVNFLVNVLTLGLKPLITNPIANGYRKKYYEGKGDKICAKRQDHISFAQFATALDVGGIRYKTTNRGPRLIPHELQNVPIRHESPTYIAHDKTKNTRINLTVLVSKKKATKSQDELAIKAKENNEFETYYPDPTVRTGQKKRVIFDEKENIWRYDDGRDSESLSVRLSEGSTFISLFGKHFPVKDIGDEQYMITTLSKEGVKKELPVYREPLSKTWHLKTVNGNPVFTEKQITFIEKIRITQHNTFQYTEIDNSQQNIYGKGTLFEVRNLQDTAQTTPPLFEVVEMNGVLVPVKSLTNKHTETHYYAYDIQTSGGSEHRVNWDGARWVLEKSTSPHVSAQLSQRISTDMYATTLNEDNLSPPDKQGIRFADGQGYLNIQSGYVAIHKGKITRVGPTNGKRITVYYRDQQFHPLVPNNKVFYWRKQFTERLIQHMKEMSIQSLQGGLTLVGIKKAAKMTFVASPLPALAESAQRNKEKAKAKEKVKVDIEVVSSTEIGRKRFLVRLNNDEYFFVEISHDGKEVWVLNDDESEVAMDKHQRNLAGGTLPTVVSLKHNIDPPTVQASSRAEIDAVTSERIESGARLFAKALNKTRDQEGSAVKLIVGHADFLATSAFENNVFSTIEHTYQALIDAFIPLSKTYPDTIIIPGSVYVSQDIPLSMQRQGLYYQQGDFTRPINHAVNFATILVPVLYKGRFVAIARKGEHLTYTKAGAPPDASPVIINNLDEAIPPGATLSIGNAKPAAYDMSSEWREAHTGAIYSGKTLLPTEKIRSEWFFCPCRDKNANEHEVERFFSNEFVIDEDKFLIVTGDEFIQHGDKRPTVRSLAFPQNETTDDSNRYDWIIHLGSRPIDDLLLTAGYNYLQADRNGNSDYYSNVNQRSLTKIHMRKQKLTAFSFTTD